MSSSRQFSSQVPQMPPHSVHQQPMPSLPYNPHGSSFFTSSLNMPPNQQVPTAHFQQQSSAAIGQPMYFTSGPLAGRAVRMEIHEIQKADLGRRYGKIDRRPIDPPPVVLLKIFEVRYPGTNRQQEREIEYELSPCQDRTFPFVIFMCMYTYVLFKLVSYRSPQTIGLICTADLFPVPPPGESAMPQTSLQAYPGTITQFNPSSSSPSTSGGNFPYQNTVQQHQNAHVSYHNMGPGASGPATEQPLHYVEGYPIMESSKQTQALAGNTFVQPVLSDFSGRNAILFVFNDLSVKLEGYFILRYRVFDIFSQEYAGDTSNRSVAAECYGGVFRMYPSKTFPGLAPSTELTKHLALLNGTRVNVRNEERHRKNVGPGGSGNWN